MDSKMMEFIEQRFKDIGKAIDLIDDSVKQLVVTGEEQAKNLHEVSKHLNDLNKRFIEHLKTKH